MMLLGKRARPPMKRATSMTEITFDLNTDAFEATPSGSQNSLNGTCQKEVGIYGGRAASEGLDQQFLADSVALPGIYRRHSSDFIGTSNFLRACSLCRRPLIPGRDIYMYRGDSAFCSLECRQFQMTQDEKKEKCSLASKNEAVASSAATGTTKGETVTAVQSQP